MCAQLRPDFAFALGRHCDMAEEARFLIGQEIPFAMEKPCGISSAEVHDIAARAAQAGVFAAVPFVLRYCPLIETIREVAAGEALQYIVFKFVGGMVDRYHQQRVPWMLDRALVRRRSPAQSWRAPPGSLPRAAEQRGADRWWVPPCPTTPRI